MPEITLKNDTTTLDPRLDRVYELDLRSLNFLVARRMPRAIATYKPRSYTHLLELWLNQFNEGACVGFGYSHDAAARPAVVMGLSNQYARELYWKFQREDPWPGGEYPGAQPVMGGTSVLTGAKVMTDLGYYESYEWALDAKEIAFGIGYAGGPCILGLDWMTGMFDTDRDGFIHAVGMVEGGHCILAVGVKIVWKSWINRFVSSTWENVDWDRSYVILHNSWGLEWGENGRAKLSLTDLDLLMKRAGEACFPKRRSIIRTPVPLAA